MKTSGAHVHDADGRGVMFAALAVLAFSSSPVFGRWAGATLTAYEITAGRMLTAGIVVLGIALWQRQALPPRADWRRFAAFGLVAALHFGFYLAALIYTSIAHALAITYTAPIFVALFSTWLLGESLDRRRWLGALVAGQRGAMSVAQAGAQHARVLQQAGHQLFGEAAILAEAGQGRALAEHAEQLPALGADGLAAQLQVVGDLRAAEQQAERDCRQQDEAEQALREALLDVWRHGRTFPCLALPVARSRTEYSDLPRERQRGRGRRRAGGRRAKTQKPGRGRASA